MGPEFNDSEGTQQDTGTGTSGFFWWLLGGDQGAWGQGSKQEALYVGTREQEEARLRAVGPGAAF